MKPTTRYEQFRAQFPELPNFRWKQVERALFDRNLTSWDSVSTLPIAMRETLKVHVPWTSITPHTVLKSHNGDTVKAAMAVEGGSRMETVLMVNAREQWTICVSSQVGCAMRCQFCATGRMGFTRNLTADEIVDQYRFWANYLRENPTLPQRISNVVFMGMGEPLANYENVRETLITLLANTDIGKTHITVSTVGMLPQMEKLLNDPHWPHVRLAVSVHSADPVSRKKIVPTSYDQFHEKLTKWSQLYLQRFGNRRHHLTFEYVMLSGVNDDDAHANKLAKFVNKIGQVKVNLIPYNTTGAQFTRSTSSAAHRFQALLERQGVLATIRHTMGDDIAAACGQLITETNTPSL